MLEIYTPINKNTFGIFSKWDKTYFFHQNHLKYEMVLKYMVNELNNLFNHNAFFSLDFNDEIINYFSYEMTNTYGCIHFKNTNDPIHVVDYDDYAFFIYMETEIDESYFNSFFKKYYRLSCKQTFDFSASEINDWKFNDYSVKTMIEGILGAISINLMTKRVMQKHFNLWTFSETDAPNNKVTTSKNFIPLFCNSESTFANPINIYNQKANDFIVVNAKNFHNWYSFIFFNQPTIFLHRLNATYYELKSFNFMTSSLFKIFQKLFDNHAINQFKNTYKFWKPLIKNWNINCSSEFFDNAMGKNHIAKKDFSLWDNPPYYFPIQYFWQTSKDYQHEVQDYFASMAHFKESLKKQIAISKDMTKKYQTLSTKNQPIPFDKAYYQTLNDNLKQTYSTIWKNYNHFKQTQTTSSKPKLSLKAKWLIKKQIKINKNKKLVW